MFGANSTAAHEEIYHTITRHDELWEGTSGAVEASQQAGQLQIDQQDVTGT
jgi:hypothetical protein